MTIVAWLLIIIGIAIAVFIVLLVLYTIANKKNEPNPAVFATDSLSLYQNPNTWSQGVPSSDPQRNSCMTYTFPGMMAGTTAFPGEPTLLQTVVDNLNPEIPGSCIDSDQIVARQLTHTCQGVTGHPSFCFLQNGNLVAVGASEIYYNTSKCDVPQCSGDLSLISLNYNPFTSYQCVSGNSSNNSLNVGTCNITDLSQLFRVTRINPGGSVPPPGQPNNGLLGQFVFRETNQCIVPSSNTPLNGASVVLGPCGLDNGFVWALIPTLSYQPGGTGSSKISPQQIAYIGGVTTIPAFETPQDIINFMTTNNILSMAPENNGVILKPFATEGGQGSSQSAQYLNYGIYNIILNTSTPF